MPRAKLDADLRERRCYICERVFVPAPQHIYHKYGKWCCRWTCYTRLLAEIEANKKKSGRPEGYSPKRKEKTHGDQEDHQPLQEKRLPHSV